MREVKFRAWDKEHRRMFDVELLDFTYPRAYPDTNQVLNYVQDDNLELMQYTGLKDKNGREIYEGDIVQWYQENPQHWMAQVDMASGRTIKQIVWHEGKFHCNQISSDSVGDVLNWHITTRPEDLEVIGNIYENPELLAKAA